MRISENDKLTNAFSRIMIFLEKNLGMYVWYPGEGDIVDESGECEG